MNHIKPILMILLIVVILALSCFYTVDQTQQAIVIQLGRPLDDIQGPGLHFKIPGIQSIAFFEQRLLTYDTALREIITKDKKTLVVDNYARWKIVDPLKFYKTVRTELTAQSRLDDIIYSIMREELGVHTLSEIISVNRSDIMEQVERKSDEQMKDFGIKIVDVRIKRADLPPENEHYVFNRMQAERERAAKSYRSEGEEAAIKIRADAERQKEIILAEAYAKAQQLKGEGDATATSIYAQSYSQNPEFYAFQRSLEAYRKALQEKNSVILTPAHPFLLYFQSLSSPLLNENTRKE